MKMKFVLIAAAALAMTACTGKSDSAASADTAAADTMVAAVDTVAEPAAQLPDFVSGKVNELTADNALTPTTKVGKVTVIDFNATWCGPCKAFAPIFEAAAAKYAAVDFVSVDIDKCPATAAAFGIESIPTVVILTPSGETLSNVGLISADELAKLIEGKK